MTNLGGKLSNSTSKSKTHSEACTDNQKRSKLLKELKLPIAMIVYPPNGGIVKFLKF